MVVSTCEHEGDDQQVEPRKSGNSSNSLGFSAR